MSEVRIASWNALNAFGDNELNEARMRDALETVYELDADVVGIQEMAAHGAHGYALEEERLEAVQEEFRKEGYTGYVTDYTPLPNARNAHYLSLWTRLDHDKTVDPLRVYGNRFALHVELSDGASIDTAHFNDLRIEERRLQAQGFLNARDEGWPSILMGDLNEMYQNDPKGRLLRVLGRAGVTTMEVDNYYDPSLRWQRFGGKAIRLCRMAQGQALADLAAGGMHDADESMQPTIGSGRIAFQLDHIMGSEQVAFKDFEVSELRDSNGKPLSDHSPISVTAEY